MSFTIGNRLLSSEKCPIVLAEVACSHDGDVERVKKMINAAVSAGADGIQFQIFSTDKLLVPTHPFYQTVKRLEISFGDWTHLIELAKKSGLFVSVNVLEESALETALLAGIDALKIHSADLSNPSMLNSIARAKLPILLSVGGSSMEEIFAAVHEMKRLGVTQIILMHGFQAFPTEISETHLNFLETIENLFGLPVGYQDHVAGDSPLATIIPIMAMGRGVVILEKHITDDRSRKGTDYESSLDPEKFIEFVKLVKESWTALGSSKMRGFSAAEKKYRETFKKSIVAARDILPNEIIEESMFLYMRGGMGIPPTDKSKILGKKVIVPMKKFDNFALDKLGS